MIVAIDPGRDKCGIVVMSEEGYITFQRVIETSALQSMIREISNKNQLSAVVLGNGTTSKTALESISNIISTPIVVVDEKHTTERARKLYWQKKPPHGWRKLLPTSMQVPPEPVDDIVAEILAREYLEGKECKNGRQAE